MCVVTIGEFIRNCKKAEVWNLRNLRREGGRKERSERLHLVCVFGISVVGLTHLMTAQRERERGGEGGRERGREGRRWEGYVSVSLTHSVTKRARNAWTAVKAPSLMYSRHCALLLFI
jgi:hypothetical protein